MLDRLIPFTYLALGDSYTIGEAVSAEHCFPMQLYRSLTDNNLKLASPTLIAKTGWTSGELLDAEASLDTTQRFDLLTLLIGVNNLYQNKSLQEYESQFNQLLDKAIDRVRGISDNIIILSIPDYGYTPFGLKDQLSISEKTKLFNSVNRGIAEQRGIRYVDITPISQQGLSNPKLLAEDLLHPSGLMYAEWTKALLPHALAILSKQ